MALEILTTADHQGFLGVQQNHLLRLLQTFYEVMHRELSTQRLWVEHTNLPIFPTQIYSLKYLHIPLTYKSSPSRLLNCHMVMIKYQLHNKNI